MTKIHFSPIGYFKSVIDESKKVVWPSRELVIRHTIMVVVAIIVSTVLFASIDYGLQNLVLKAVNR